MTTQPRRRILSLVLAGVLAVTTPMLLAGCGLIPNPLEGIIEGATGGDVDLGGDSVPEDFPAEVPLVDGTVEYGGSIGNGEQKVWNVTIRSTETGLVGTIASQLADAGFSATVEGTVTGDTGTLAYGNDAYGILVFVAEDGDAFVVNYSVTQNQPADENSAG